MTDATQAGAPEQKANPLEGAAVVPAAENLDRIKSPRQQALDEIAAKQRHEPPEKRDEQGRFASDTPKPAPDQKPETEAKPPEPPRYKVKIDGEEREVTIEELQRGYQTAQASQRRFEEAKRLREEAERRDQQQRGTVSAPQQTAKPDTAADPHAQLVKEVSHALAYGSKADIERATAKLVSAVGQKGQPAWDAQQTQSLVQFEIRRQMEWDNTLRSFNETYKDVADDPHINRIALEAGAQFIAEDLASAGYDQRTIQQLAARGQLRDAWDNLRSRQFPVRSYEDMARHAGDTARKWRDEFIGRYAPQQQTTPPDLYAQRAAAKAGNSSPPSASAGARQASQPPRQNKSQADIIAETRRSRGQA